MDTRPLYRRAKFVIAVMTGGLLAASFWAPTVQTGVQAILAGGLSAFMAAQGFVDTAKAKNVGA